MRNEKRMGYKKGKSHHCIITTYPIYPYNYITPSYRKANASALLKVNPTTVHPVTIICLLVNCFPISQTRCLHPLNEWNVNGNAAANLRQNLAASGKPANAAAIDADSRCHPRSGATRYAEAKMYRPPDKTTPVMRFVEERIQVIWGR